MRREGLLLVIAVPVAALACDGIIGTRDLDYNANAVNGGGPGAGGEAGVDGGPAPTCNADLQTDKNNCGACGQDCSKGNCAGGICTMVDQQFGAGGIALDGTKVYAAIADGHVVSCSKSGCSGGATVLFVNSDSEPQRIRVNGDVLYFSSYYGGDTFQTGVYRTSASKPDSPTRLTPLGQTETSEFNIGADASVLYWGNDDDPMKGWQECAFGTCDASVPLEDGVASYDSLFLPNGALVWSTDSGVHYCTAGTNCATSPIIYSEPSGWVAGMAYDDMTQLLVFTVDHESGTDKVVSCPAIRSKCNPTNVVASARFPRGIAAGGGTVYFVETGTIGPFDDGGIPNDGTVSKCTLNSSGSCGSITPIATGLMSPNRIAIDDKSIYWTNEGLVGNFGVPGSIMKAPR